MTALPRQRAALCLLVLWLLHAPAASSALAKPAKSSAYTSKFYRLESDLPRQQASDLARHMDTVFAEYQKRFEGFGNKSTQPLPLYIFQTKEAYVAFLEAKGINAANTGGIFFAVNRDQGLATYIGQRDPADVLSTLQHEGFHQFAFHHIGTSLPIWVNEGVAQYFEDAVLVKGRMQTGFSDARRMDLVKDAIRASALVDFSQMLSMEPQTWLKTVNEQPQKASLLYAQAWSMAYFLIHGDGGKYQKGFEAYLSQLSKGVPSDQAFRDVFGKDTNAFRDRWLKYAQTAEPDPLTDAVTKMRFLGAGLAWINENNRPQPRTLAELRNLMKKAQFRQIFPSSLGSLELRAADDNNFRYRSGNGNWVEFQLLPPAQGSSLAQITARSLKPVPTLRWVNFADSKLQMMVQYE